MKTRIVSGLILIGITALCFLKGNNFLLGFLYITSLAATHELLMMSPFNHNKKVIALSYLVLHINFFYLLKHTPLPLYLLSLYNCIGIIFILLSCIELQKKNHLLPHLTGLYFRIFNISIIMPTFIFLIQNTSSGLQELLLISIIIIICDSMAYFTGKSIGKRPLTIISPKKTIEGSLYGSLTSLICGCILLYTVNTLTIGTILLTLAIIILSQIGDLTISLLKRRYNIKDSSKLIPGHGGILDRLDSFSLCIPFYFIIKFYFNIGFF